MKSLRNKVTAGMQKGFTLIELVIVIVIIGILAAVAIPNFTSLTTDAQQAAVKGIAGALGSASSTNFAIRSGFPAKGVAVGDCTAVSGALQGGLDGDYTITPATITPGGTATCTLTGPGPQTATFVGHGIN